MALVTRRDLIERPCNIVTTEIARASRMVSSFTGHMVQANKAIVGKNAFAHESGIHQDGVLKERTTYEIMHARDIGLSDSDIVLGKHSGRHALRSHLAEMGIQLDGAELDEVFRRFKIITDKKKEVTTADLEALVGEEMREREDMYSPRPLLRVRRYRHHLLQPGGGGQAGRDAGRQGLLRGFGGVHLHGHRRRGGSDRANCSTTRCAPSPRARTRWARCAWWWRWMASSTPVSAVSIDVLEASAKAYMRALNNVAMKREAGGARGDRVYL